MRRVAIALLVAAGLGVPARGQGTPAHAPPRAAPSAPPNELAGPAVRVRAERLEVPGAAWVRVRFEAFDLGAASWLLLTSEADDGWQVLDARSLERWNQASAVFNGPAVRLELWAASGEEGVFARVGALEAGDAEGGFPESLCGADDKQPLLDNRVARLFPIPCTTWRVTNGAFLTAGHCGQYLTDLVQFNVPPSLPNGVPVSSHPNDQYPLDLATIQFVDGGIGNDWAVFGVGPNSNTGLLPHEAYGLAFRATQEAPDAGDTIRITGFGLDDMPPGTEGAFNADNLTSQTAVGPLLGELPTPVGIQLEYQTDTTTGNSGSPIVWDALGLTIGVHSHLGCGDVAGNHGTSFEHAPLAAALDGFPGADVRYVDAGHPLPVQPDGTLFRPFATVSAGVLAVPRGGILSIVTGVYPEAATGPWTIDRPMTLTAPNGPVTIGD